MEHIQNILNNYLKGSRKDSINHGIARYMLVHIQEICNSKLADVAETCNVSAPSVIRFCRELGFKDFSDFKIRVQEEIENYFSLPEWGTGLDVSDDSEKYQDSVAAWRDQLSKQTYETLLQIDKEKVEGLVEDIIQYKYVYIFGLSLSTVFAEYLRILLVFENKSINTRQMPNYDSKLTPDRENTLVIIVSQHGLFIKDTPQVIPYLRENSDKLWLITQKEDKKPSSMEIDDTLFVKGGGNRTLELHGLMNLAELIVAFYKNKTPKQEHEK